jgi:uncharacterized protein (TIGR03086 family)
VGELSPADAYQRAAALFGETIASLDDEQWELPARGDDFTVETVVAWVVVGDAQIIGAIDDGRVGEVGNFDTSVLGPNKVATWRGTAVGAIRALSEPGAVERHVRHPEGDLAVATLVGLRVSENLVRAWDIGQAVGGSVEIPDDLAEWCLDFWAGHTDVVTAGGILPDAPRQPAADAGPAERLLALTGR